MTAKNAIRNSAKAAVAKGIAGILDGTTTADAVLADVAVAAATAEAPRYEVIHPAMEVHVAGCKDVLRALKSHRTASGEDAADSIEFQPAPDQSPSEWVVADMEDAGLEGFTADQVHIAPCVTGAKAPRAPKAKPAPEPVAAPEVGTCSGVYLTSDPDTHVACTEPRASASNKLCKAHSKAYQAGTAKMSAKGAHAMVALVAAGVEVAYGKRAQAPAPEPAKPAKAAAKKPAKGRRGDGSETAHRSTPPAPPKEPISRVKGTVAEAGHNGAAQLVAVSA